MCLVESLRLPLSVREVLGHPPSLSSVKVDYTKVYSEGCPITTSSFFDTFLIIWRDTRDESDEGRPLDRNSLKARTQLPVNAEVLLGVRESFHADFIG